MQKNLSRLAAAALLGAASFASHGASLTLSQWTFGNGNGVKATAPAYSGPAGGFRGTLSGSGTSFDGNIDSYCVELGQDFDFGKTYKNYNLVSASSYFGDTKATALGQLLSHANPLIDDAAARRKDDFSTSLQLAIWNIVNDGDDSLLRGTFKDRSSFAAKADDFLNGAKTQVNQLDLWVLTNDKQQDQLIWRQGRDPRQDVPEPATLALALAALGGLGIGSRRRKAR